MLTEMRGISADFEGCEIRVAAALAGDTQLYEAEAGVRCHRCKTDADDSKTCACGPHKAHQGLHWLTAHTAHGEDATKEHRYQAKRGTFTRLFGGGPSTAADQVGCDVTLMYQVWEAFNMVAPVYTAWDEWLRESYETGMMVWRDYQEAKNWRVEIPGAKRMIYRTYSGRLVYVTKGPHAAGNGAIQGTARELLVDGLLRWKNTRWGKLAVLPVHDQIISLVPSCEAEVATQELARCMSTDVLSSPGFHVSIGVDVDKPFISWPDSS
jgi:DNA polymerase I-like protein with 3'-5' exonuclease and polymerase domains